MKHPLVTAAAAAGALAIIACVDAPVSPTARTILPPSFAINANLACGSTTTVKLVTGGGFVLGNVAAWNDDTDLHVSFNVTRGHLAMREAHLQPVTSVGAIPLTVGGNPALGKFLYSNAFGPPVQTYEYVVPLASIGVGGGDNIVLAAIAVGEGPGGQTSQAWGDGSQIHPPNKAEYFNHVVQRCAPPPGTDVVVVNDINVFDLTAMSDPNNQLFVTNLANYTTAGPRNSATEVVWDRGRFSACYVHANNECNDTNMGTTRTTITNAGLSIVDIESSAGTLDDIFAASGANWKEIWLWLPVEAFDKDEINALKLFASEGGRVLFIGEWAGYYPPAGIAVENQFLLDMGAVMTNTGGAVDCGYQVVQPASLRPHQITAGLTGLTMACSSVLLPGAQDFPLYLDQANTNVLSAVATIDVTPLTALRRPTRGPLSLMAVPPGLNKRSSTGW